MSRYHINEAELDLPLTWSDHSLNVFADTACLPAACTLVITRGQLREGEDLDRYSQRQGQDIDRAARSCREIQRFDLTVDGRQAIAVDVIAHHVDGHADVHQRQVHVLNQTQVLTLTLSANADRFADASLVLEEILASLRFRGLTPPALTDRPAPDDTMMRSD